MFQVGVHIVFRQPNLIIMYIGDVAIKLFMSEYSDA